MITEQIKRRIRFEIETQKMNVNEYKYYIKKLENIELLTESEMETFIEELNKKNVIKNEYKIKNKVIKVKTEKKNNNIYFNVKVEKEGL